MGVKCRIVVSENCSESAHADQYDRLFDALPKRIQVVRRKSRLPVEDHFRWLSGMVETPYMVFLADDDVLVSDFVSRALALAEAEDHAVVFGPYRAEWKASGESRVRSFNYSSRIKFVRLVKFVCRRNDTFVYGLFKTGILRKGLRELIPLRILGRRTLTRITYPPLFSCLLDGSYGHLGGGPVWVSTVDSRKNEAYLSTNNVLKLVYLVLGEPILAARFIRLAFLNEGVLFAAALSPFVLGMALVEAAGFILFAARRFASLALAHARRRVVG